MLEVNLICPVLVQIAEAFGEAYVSSRVASLRLVYPSGYVPAPVEFPQGSYPVTFTTYFTITFDPSQMTLAEYLAQFSAKYVETLATDLGEMLCHVNLIPVNPTEGGAFQRPAREFRTAFQQKLREYGVPSTIRMEKGIDINAGCGQLRARAVGTDEDAARV